METSWLLFRLFKFLGLLVYGWGLLTALYGRDRVRGALWAAPVGFGVMAVSGFGMLEARGLTLAEPWASGGLLLGTLSVAGAFLLAAAERSRAGAAMALGGGLGALAMMVFRFEGGHSVAGLALVLGAVLGALTVQRDAPVSNESLGHSFAWMARAEGLSLLFLFGVAMPAKYLADLPVLTQWGGLFHGILFLLYVASLGVYGRRAGWSLPTLALGGLASLLPFGTFAFERRMQAD